MDNSPLNRLPPELRIRIFKEALTFGDIYYNQPSFPVSGRRGPDKPNPAKVRARVRAGKDKFDPAANDPQYDIPLVKLLALTLTCKQVRNESTNLVFEANTLHLGDTCWKHFPGPGIFFYIHGPTGRALKSVPEIFRSNQAEIHLHLRLTERELGSLALMHRFGETEYGGPLPLVGRVGQMLAYVHPCTLVVHFHINGFHFPECDWFLLDVDEGSASKCFELRANDNGVGLAALKRTTTRSMQQIRDHPVHEGDCWYRDDNGVLRTEVPEFFHFEALADQLVRSMENAYTKATLMDSNLTGPAVDEPHAKWNAAEMDNAPSPGQASIKRLKGGNPQES
ncbi:hypothetical protein Q7P37_001621 [Cladosporium fusiforme]